MARLLRDFKPGEIYHIVNRGNRRQPIFDDARDYDRYLEILEESLDRMVMRIIGFALMPNHFHLMLWPTEQTSISTYMQWVSTKHARGYNLRHGLVGTGHVYQDRFRAGWCNSEPRVLATLRYIEANPVSASLVDAAESWEWSSLWQRTNGDPRGLLCPAPIELPSNWTDVVNERGQRGRLVKSIVLEESEEQSAVVAL
jgi:putative transposase